MPTRISLVPFLLLFLSHWVTAQTFPLQVSPDNRHLQTADNRPFFYQADTPWWILYRLEMDEVADYLDTRKAQGFNALQIMLTGGKDLKNIYGEGPFPGDNDLSRPNERYFARADSILDMATERGFLLALVPLWSGCCREDYAGEDGDGNPLPLNINGAAKAEAYGRWLGDRYGDRNNILWIIGGDNDPFNARDEIDAYARGLAATTTGQLFTYHPSSTHSSTDVWPRGTPWLDVSMVYTYFRGFERAWNRIQPDVYEVSRTEWNKNELPFFLGESTYEGEHLPRGSAQQVRKQAWWAALSGATGHAYGSPNWRLDPADDWRANLQLPGAASLGHLPTLLTEFGWPAFDYDFHDELLVTGRGQYASNDFAVAAYARDYRAALIYLPSARPVGLSAGQLRGDGHRVRWFDPRTGQRHPAETLAYDREYAPPGEGDWVLIVEAN